LTTRAVDIAQPDTCSAGGLSECKKIADMAAACSIRYAPHVWGTGVALAAALQLLAVLPAWTPPSLRQAILATPIEHRHGVVAIPGGPGLGIEIDRAALQRFGAS
jgi:D-galactarolactone cycloisomerase